MSYMLIAFAGFVFGILVGLFIAHMSYIFSLEHEMEVEHNEAVDARNIEDVS